MVRIYGVTTTNNTSVPSGSIISMKLYGSTTNDGETNLTSDGESIETYQNIFSTSTNKSVSFIANIIASNLPQTPSYNASWTIHGMLSKGSSSALTKLYVSSADAIADSAFENLEVSLSENTVFGGLSIKCKGLPNYNVINWVATITGSEV